MLGFGDKEAEKKKALEEEAAKAEAEKLALEAKTKADAEKAEADAKIAKEYAEMKEKLARLEGKDEGRVLSTPAPAPTPEPVFDVPTVDTIAAALTNEDGTVDPRVVAEQILKASETIASKKVYELDRDRVSQIEAVGLNALDDISDRVSRGDMVYIQNGLLTKEYNDVINTIPVANRANPGVRKMAYDQVVGQNAQKVVEYELDKASRNEEPPPTGDVPGGSRDKHTGGDKLTAASLGKEASDLLTSSNRSLARIAAQFGMTEDAYLQYAKDQGFIE